MALSVFLIENEQKINGRPESLTVVAHTPEQADALLRATTWPGKVDENWADTTITRTGVARGSFKAVTSPAITGIYGVPLGTWTTS
jgi:hypothetical protein